MEFKSLKKRYKCDDCSSTFKKTAYLKDHKASVHSELRPFQCEHCNYSAKQKGTLRSHYAKHFPQIYKNQTCPICQYKCAQASGLRIHLRVHTKEKPFACKMCSFRASTRSVLTVHTRSHTGEKPYKCSLCTSAFSQSGGLKRHILFVHNKNKVCLIVCSVIGCDRKFTNKLSLSRHVDNVHKKEKCFSCPHCQKAFYAKSHCVSHIQQHHASERPYKCSVCDYSSVRLGNVKTHESNLHGKYLDVECPVCHRKYKNDFSLACHQKYAHSKAEGSKEAAPNWKCKEPGCTKEYKFRKSLKRHVNSFHLQKRPFKCLLCPHATTTFTYLNDHLKTHTKEKPNCCDLCQRSFISSSVLSTHMVTAHSERRPFQCELCPYSTKSKYILKKHKIIHGPLPTTSGCSSWKESKGSSSKKRTNYLFRTRSNLIVHKKLEVHLKSSSLAARIRNVHGNKISPEVLPPTLRDLRTITEHVRESVVPGGSNEGVINPKTEQNRTKAFYTAGDCPPCFVPLVRVKELKIGSPCKNKITIYA